MVQHTLIVKNVASPLLQVELQKVLGDKHKIVNVSFTKKAGKKGEIKHATVVVESKATLATLVGLVNNKAVHGKELAVTAAKKPHEKASFVARVAELKKLEKFSSVWPAPTYKKVANSDPLKNSGFPTAFVHGQRLTIEVPKTIKKKVAAPSRALYLSKVPKTVSKRQIMEAFKATRVQTAIFSKNKKRLNYAFIIFKNADERKKAQEAVKDKIVIGDNTIAVHEATKFAKQIVEVPNEKAQPKPAAAGEKKELSVNAIARKRFAAYRLNLHNRKQRLIRRAAVKKIKEHKTAVAQGKAQARVVRKLKAKSGLVKANPQVLKLQAERAARKAFRAKARLEAKNKRLGKKPAAKPAAKPVAAAAASAETATA